MTLIDTYRRNVASKKTQKTKAMQDKSRAMAKISSENKKIINAKQQIGRTKSMPTIKSKLRIIESSEKRIATISKTVALLDAKIARLEKIINDEERKVYREEERLNKQRILEQEEQSMAFAQQNTNIQSQLEDQGKIQREMLDSIHKLESAPKEIVVLYLASNPKNAVTLRLDEEAREIEEMIRKAKHRDSVKFVTKWAVRPLDILQAINEYDPTIVHFSGHGTEQNDLVLENPNGTVKLVSKEAIVLSMTTSSDNIKLVFFNNCFSSGQAESVVEHVDFAIGMNIAIGDQAAIKFAAQFYSSIGFGKTVYQAFMQAKTALLLESIIEEDTPELFSKNEGSEKEVKLVNPT